MRNPLCNLKPTVGFEGMFLIQSIVLTFLSHFFNGFYTASFDLTLFIQADNSTELGRETVHTDLTSLFTSRCLLNLKGKK